MNMKTLVALLTLGLVQIAAANDEIPVFTIVIEAHLFRPNPLIVPAHQKFKLQIVNKDDTPEEFDSFDLNREKVIYPRNSAILFIGPLPPGDYYYFGEYHPSVSNGFIQVSERAQHVDQ